jgi:hypothetical protein
MDQKIVGIVGAIAGLAALDATQGAATAAPNPEAVKGAHSYGELLNPIPNALALLRAADNDAARTQASNDVRVALDHHHHHHHRYVKPKRRHHHHHHHHHND